MSTIIISLNAILPDIVITLIEAGIPEKNQACKGKISFILIVNITIIAFSIKI